MSQPSLPHTSTSTTTVTDTWTFRGNGDLEELIQQGFLANNFLDGRLGTAQTLKVNLDTYGQVPEVTITVTTTTRNPSA